MYIVQCTLCIVCTYVHSSCCTFFPSCNINTYTWLALQTCPANSIKKIYFYCSLIHRSYIWSKEVPTDPLLFHCSSMPSCPLPEAAAEFGHLVMRRFSGSFQLPVDNSKGAVVSSLLFVLNRTRLEDTRQCLFSCCDTLINPETVILSW